MEESAEQQQPEKIELPPKYYLGYFDYLLDFVQEKYRPLLETNEWAFIRQYYCLSEDARCLFIRFSNRRGLFFRVKTLRYEELDNISVSLQELLDKGFASRPDAALHQPSGSQLLGIFTKPELLKLFPLDKAKPLKKEDLVERILEQVPFDDIVDLINQEEAVVKVNFEQEVAFMKFLFFGNRYLDMTEFVVRDLGLSSYHQYNDDALVARFATRREAEDKWLITDQYQTFKELQETATPTEIYDWYLTLAETLTELSEVALPSYERLTLRVARFLERQKLLEEALAVYQLTQQVPSRERQVRLLEKLKKVEEAIALSQQMAEYSHNADEHFFATDFLNRQAEKKRTTRKSTTEELSQAESITIDAAYRRNVEWGTVQHFLEKGQLAAHTENLVWRALFGLTFWDIIFDPSLVAFHHPFQRRPSDLHLPAFYEKRKEMITSRLAALGSDEEALKWLGQVYEEQYGTANPFVIWVEEMWPLIRKTVVCVGWEKLAIVLHEMSKNMVENARGFPDLFIWHEETNMYEFVEVKSPTDHLSNQQLFWLRFMKKHGIEARVLRVYFAYSPSPDHSPPED